MVKGSIHPQNITMLDVTMLTMELKIHEAKKDRTAGETDTSTITETSAFLLNIGISRQKSMPSHLALLTSVEHPTQSHKIDHVLVHKQF